MNLSMPTGPFKTLLLWGALAALAACGTVPTSYTPAGVQPPESLTTAIEDARDAERLRRTTLPDDAATTMPLTRDGVILAALARNRTLAVEELNPVIAEYLPALERAAFDPRVLATTSIGRDTRQLGGTAAFSFPGDSTPELHEDTLGANATASQYFPTGTEIFLSGGIRRTDTNFTDSEYFGQWSAGVNQALLRGAGTRVNLVGLRQAENIAARSLHELRSFVTDLVEQAENAYWGLVLAMERVRIQESSIELAREQVRLNESFLRAGRGTTAAVLSAKAEEAARRADLIDAQAEVRRRTLELIRLLNPDNDNQWALNFDPQDPPEVTFVEIDDAVSDNLSKRYRALLAQAKLDLANRELEVVRTRNGVLPRLDAFASYGRTSLGPTQSDAFNRLDDSAYQNYELGLQFEMYPLNRAERARRARARFQQEQAEAALANLEQLVSLEVRQAAVEARRQWERLQATRQTVESREEELRAEESRYRVGRSTTLDVLRIQRDLVQARVDEIGARVGYIRALTNLYRAEGTLLDRRGVSATPPSEMTQ